MKSSLPIAFCLMVKGRWSDATAFRVSLRETNETKRRVHLRRSQKNHCLRDDIIFSSLSQQAHEVIGSAGVQAQGWDGHVRCGVAPVLVVVLHAVEHTVGRGRLTVDHLPCGHMVQTALQDRRPVIKAPP